MILAMDILTLGPCRSLYLRSTPFQKEITYLLIATLSSPWSLNICHRINLHWKEVNHHLCTCNHHNLLWQEFQEISWRELVASVWNRKKTSFRWKKLKSWRLFCCISNKSDIIQYLVGRAKNIIFWHAKLFLSRSTHFWPLHVQRMR